MHVGATIKERLSRDTEFLQRWKPAAVDLHDADVFRAILVDIDGIGSEVGLGLCNRAQKVRVDVIALGRLIETGSAGTTDEKE